MSSMNALVRADFRYLVHQLAGDFLREEAPGLVSDFERDFDALFDQAEDRLRQLRSEDVHGDWRLPFDATFGDGLFLGSLVGIAAFLVRETLAAGERRREKWIRKLEAQLSRQTGQPELVVALCARVLDLAERFDRVSQMILPPDLELQVHLSSASGSTALTYVLHSAIAGYHFEQIPGPVLRKDPEDFAASLFEQIEKLHARVDLEGGLLLLEEIEEELASLGRSLYLALFPPAMREAYRRFRHVHSIQITSDEPAIPWELIKPFDDTAEPAIDDDFLCMRFQLTRWRNGRPPVPVFPVRRLACFGGTDLPKARDEHALLAGLATRHPGVDNASPRTALYSDFEALLRTGGCDLLHFVGHGDLSPGRADEAKLVLEDRSFRARHLTGPITTRIKKDRPLVFLNACRVARQAWSLTGLGGWVEAWVRTCECGAFLGPQWVVRDSQAYELARVFYQELEQGRTLGEAALEARHALRQQGPGRQAWLALAVYGHPNAQVHFGTEPDISPPPMPSRRELPEPPPDTRPAVSTLFDTADRRPGRDAAAPAAGASLRPLPPLSFLGREQDMRRLWERLCHGPAPGADHGSLLLMTGWPGVGKTTMTTALANREDLREAFPDGILWTALDQSPNLHKEISSWCVALGSPGPSPAATIDEASLQLGSLLRRRRVLLLVDDVWDPVHARPFLVGGPGCATLVTTRLDAVAEQLAPTSRAIYRLPVLSEDAGLELLRSRAPEVVAAHPDECRILVHELEGLPLSLHVAGRMLAKESRLWSPVDLLESLREGRQLLAESAPSDRTDVSRQTLPTLSVLLAKSTERLPPELLERFAYLGDFAPKPATFGLPALKAAWGVDDPRPSVRVLVDLGLLEPAGEGRFRMHALLVAFAKSLLET